MNFKNIDPNNFDIKNFIPAPREDPTSYPGKRPKNSFLFYSDSIFHINMIKDKRLEESLVIKNGNEHTIENELKNPKTTKLEDRYLVIGYGSNANPAQLKNKFQGTTSIFPVLKGRLENFDIVYASFFSPYGAIPATIDRSNGTSVEVWANLLDKKQFELMDKTEGRGKSYWLVKIDGELILENGESFSPIYSYVATSGVLTLKQKLIRLKEVNVSDPSFQELTEIELLKIMHTKLAEDSTLEEFLSKILKNKDNIQIFNEFLKEKLSTPHKLKFKKMLPNEMPEKIVNMKRFFKKK